MWLNIREFWKHFSVFLVGFHCTFLGLEVDLALISGCLWIPWGSTRNFKIAIRCSGYAVAPDCRNRNNLKHATMNRRNKTITGSGFAVTWDCVSNRSTMTLPITGSGFAVTWDCEHSTAAITCNGSTVARDWSKNSITRQIRIAYCQWVHVCVDRNSHWVEACGEQTECNP